MKLFHDTRFIGKRVLITFRKQRNRSKYL